MGSVYRAQDPMMDRTVAIKTILAAALSGPLAQEYRERFIREARAAGRLSHPGIVTVYDVSEENGTPYLVMEFINGRSLAAAMDAGERFSIDRIYELGQQVAEALGYAHRNGVVHRDVKPANILLATPGPGETERAKLADLGVAKLTATQITTTGQLLGTPAFMPPEQFTGVPIDGRADLFSLGVILYWIATGDKPFAGDTITAVSYKIVHSEPPPPRRINPAVPVALERIIMKCLEKDPAARYATGEALAADLAAGRAGRDLTQNSAAPAQRTAAGAVLAPVATMSGDPNTTLDSDVRLQMAVDTSAARPAAPIHGKPGVRPGTKFGTPALLGIAIAIALLLVGSAATVKLIHHRRQLRAEEQAQAQALAQAQAQQEALAQMQAAETETAAATADQGATQPPGVNPSGEASSGTASSDKVPPDTTASEKKPVVRTSSNRTPKKQTSPPPQTAGTSADSASPEGTTAQPVQPPVNPAPGATTTTTSPANATTPAPSNPAQPPPAAKAEGTSPTDSAKLHIDDGQVPNAASFVVLMDGKQIFERKSVAEGAASPKEDDLAVSPGDHEFSVMTDPGGLEIANSSSVKEKFQSKKKMILKIELRDSTSGKTLKKNSHLDAGKSEFLISLKAANLFGF
jgi:serine/threonine-protein kinase